MKKYNCPNCNAELYWNEDRHALYCEYCGHTYNPEELNIYEQKKNSSFINADETQKATDNSANDDLVVYKCSHCGAEVVTARSTMATKCAYCGRAITLSNKSVDNFNPEFVIPFSINKDAAINSYKDFCKSKINIPNKFYENATVKEIKGVYVPFWLHDFNTKIDTKFNFIKNKHTYKSGYDKVTVSSLYNKHLKGDYYFEKYPTDALKRLNDDLMDSIIPYNYKELMKFNPGYMAGFYAETYDEDSEEAQNKALYNATKKIIKDVEKEYSPYDFLQESDFNFDCKDISSYYAMMPVWLIHITYKDKDYLGAVNGQTGKAYGNFPMSGLKMARPFFYTLFYMIISLIIGYFIS